MMKKNFVYAMLLLCMVAGSQSVFADGSGKTTPTTEQEVPASGATREKEPAPKPTVEPADKGTGEDTGEKVENKDTDSKAKEAKKPVTFADLKTRFDALPEEEKTEELTKAYAELEKSQTDEKLLTAFEGSLTPEEAKELSSYRQVMDYAGEHKALAGAGAAVVLTGLVAGAAACTRKGRAFYTRAWNKMLGRTATTA